MKITFVISSLRCGGAERALVLLAQGLSARKQSVSVVTLNSADTDFFTLPNGIRRIALNPGGKSANILQGLFKALRNLMALRQAVLSTSPDVVVSSMDITNVKILLLFKWTKLPVIVAEQIDPVMVPIGKIWDKLRRWLYPDAACLVSVGNGIDQHFSWLPEAKRTVILNPCVKDDQTDRNHEISREDSSTKCITAMGRLAYQKRFDLLIRAFAKLVHRYPQWRLTIIGDGILLAELKTLRDELGLADKVSFPGALKNPYPVLKHADLFVLSSRAEGFPLSLCEAMACGLPVISTDCNSGPREIIRDGVDGVLVPPEDVDALEAAMDRLMSDEVERNRLASRAVEVTERFSLEKVCNMWEDLLSRAVLMENNLGGNSS